MINFSFKVNIFLYFAETETQLFSLNIFDATLHGNEITNSKIEGLHKVYAPHYYSYASVNTAIEKYSAYRIKLFGDLDGETVELFGIELRLFQS